MNTPYAGQRIAGKLNAVIPCLIGHSLTLTTAHRLRDAAALPLTCVSSRQLTPRRRNRHTNSKHSLSRALVVCVAVSFSGLGVPRASAATTNGVASWYGEEHRGKLMSNGKRFNPDKFTAASWFYPLGAKVRVTLASPSEPPRSVVVTITDRGPAKDLVRDGRIIDLSHAPFKQLAPPYLGLVAVAVQLVE